MYMCGWMFFRPHVHVLSFHTHSIWPLFWHIYIYIYKRTSSRFSSHTLIIVDPLEAKLGNSHILPVSREWVYGNASVTCKWGFFLTYFLCVRNAFVAGPIFCRPTWPLFHTCHLISSCFFFEGRPVSMVVAHPAGSQVCFFFRLGRIRKEGGGHKN